MSKLKSTWDAVNDLECGALKPGWCNYIAYNCYHGFYFLQNNSKFSVCTVDEFNALVEDMTLGLDVNQVSKRRLEEYIDADKQELEPVPVIDWDSAPEDATHYCPSNKQFSEVFIKDLTDDGYSYKVVGGSYVDNEWEYTSPIVKGELHGIVKRPAKQQLNIYTQDMADNGVKPSVGMKCLFKMNGEYKTITVLYNSQEVMVFSYIFDGVTVEDARVKSFNNIDIKPIDQRTKKERAIDEIESELSKIAYSTRSALELAYDEWVGE